MNATSLLLRVVRTHPRMMTFEPTGTASSVRMRDTFVRCQPTVAASWIAVSPASSRNCRRWLASARRASCTVDEWYADTRLPVFAWSSQARGFFSGRYARDKTEGEGMDQQNVIRTYYSDANWERYDRADELAREKGCTRQQVVLAWPPPQFAWFGYRRW